MLPTSQRKKRKGSMPRGTPLIEGAGALGSDRVAGHLHPPTEEGGRVGGAKNSANSLHQGSAGSYSEGPSVAAHVGCPKEEFREGAYPVPHRQHVLGFSGGYLAGNRAQPVARGRESRGPAIALEDYRGEGYRRPSHRARRLFEGPHHHGSDRAGRARAALDLRRELKV